MGLREVRDYFAKFNRDQEIVIVDESSATVALAAQSLGVEEARIAKSLAFIAKEEPFIVVVAGDVKIDNRKYKDFFKAKAKMLNAEQVAEYTGHEVGGVCPFALKKQDMKVYFDESLKRFESFFPACGSRNSAIKLTLDELEIHSGNPQWVDVSKPIEG